MKTPRKPKIQKSLAPLSKAQLDQLDLWLETHTYAQVLELMAKPAPQGFGLVVSQSVVQLRYQKNQMARILSEHAEDKLTVEQLQSIYAAQPIDYSSAGINLLMKNAFKLALNPDNKPGDLKDLLRVLSFPITVQFTERRIKLSEQSLALRKQAVGRRSRGAETNSPLPTHNPELSSESGEEYTLRMRRAFLSNPELRPFIPGSTAAQLGWDLNPKPSVAVEVTNLTPSAPVGDDARSLTSPSEPTTATSNTGSASAVSINEKVGDDVRSLISDPIQPAHPSRTPSTKNKHQSLATSGPSSAGQAKGDHSDLATKHSASPTPTPPRTDTPARAATRAAQLPLRRDSGGEGGGEVAHPCASSVEPLAFRVARTVGDDVRSLISDPIQPVHPSTTPSTKNKHQTLATSGPSSAGQAKGDHPDLATEHFASPTPTPPRTGTPARAATRAAQLPLRRDSGGEGGGEVARPCVSFVEPLAFRVARIVGDDVRSLTSDPIQPAHPSRTPSTKNKDQSLVTSGPSSARQAKGDHSDLDTSHSISEAPDDPSSQTVPGETETGRQIREENIAREALNIAVHNYTMRRCDEYNAWLESKSYNGIMYDNSKPYFSNLRECPCGQSTPCPAHGEMPTFFWKNSPWSFLYAKALADYDLPFHPMWLPEGPPGQFYSDPSRWRPDN